MFFRLFQTTWGETLLLVLGGSLLMWLMTQPAFGSFFLGEDFIYLGQYRARGNAYWAGVLSPTDGIFFRPLLCAVNLLWHFVLPLDPWVHHIRNFGFSVVNLFLLSRILTYLAMSRAARAVAVLFFAVSKIHLTAIGYVNVYDSILTLMLLLATILCFLRYIANRRPLDYGLGLFFCVLSTFTRDYGVVVVGVIVALVAFCGIRNRSWRIEGGRWAKRLAPLLAMLILYVAVRSAIVGPLPRSHAVYSPRLTADVSLRKVLVFTSTLGNLALTEFVERGTTGGNGLGTWLVKAIPGSRPAGWGDAVLYVGFTALFGGTLIVGRRSGLLLLFPLVWIAAYFGPTLLTRNLQMYYMYEPLAGAAVLLGLCLDRAGRRMIALWSAALVVIIANGTISNYTSLYHWQFAANKAQKIQHPVLTAHRGETIESITFVSESIPFWQWTLMSGPMVPEMLKQPALKVRFVDHDHPAIGESDREAHPGRLFFDADNDFVLVDTSSKRTVSVLLAISPAWARVGIGFNVQPSGVSAMGLRAENATAQTVVMMGDRRLETTFGSSHFLSAVVPGDLLTRAGRHPVYLRNSLGDSNQLEFVVGLEDLPPHAGASAATPPSVVPSSRPLILRQLSAGSTRAGQGFDVQPDGQSALSIDCENAVPGTVVMFDDTPLVTAYGHKRWLTATVPSDLYRRPGQHKVYLKNGTSESNRLDFVVQPR